MMRLGQTLARRLGRRIPYAFKETHQREVTTWTIQPGFETKEVRTGVGRGNEHAMIVGLPSGTDVYVGYSEEWQIAGQQRIFKESRLRFYWPTGSGILPGPPRFRLEWATRDEQNDFPGAGAGHPHWQFSEPENLPDDADEIASELESNETDETALLVDRPGTLPDARTVPGRFHFPAKALWDEAEWDPDEDPQGADLHAFCPTAIDHLDNWMLSAIRYVRSEMTKYGVV